MSNKFLQLSVCVSLLLTLILLIAILVVVNSMPDVPTNHSKGPCLPTEEGMSCEPDQFSSLVRQETVSFYSQTKRSYDNDEKGNDFKDLIGLKSSIKNHHEDMRPAARLVGEIRNRNRTVNSTPRNGMVPLTSWKDRRFLYSSGGFRRFGVQFRNGRIMVPVAGLYEVYSYVQFREPCKNGRPVNNNTDEIRQSVYKFDITDGEETELMSCTMSHKISKNIYTNIYDSYTSSIFNLRAGDELSVRVNQADLMQYPEYNFFGVNFIQSPDKPLDLMLH